MSKPIYMIAHGSAAVQAAQIIAAAQSRKLPVAVAAPTKTPAIQLEIAAQWLEEATYLPGADRDNLKRVARECRAVAHGEGK